MIEEQRPAQSDAQPTNTGAAPSDTSPELIHDSSFTIHDSPSIVIDLGTPDGRAVLVTAHGWQLLDRSPVLFRRTPFTGVLPLPERGGRLDQLRQFISTTDEGWSLLRGWLVASLFPAIDHPILRLVGAKNTVMISALQMISRLIDPSRLPVRTKPTNRENWLASAHGSWCLAIQNVSQIPDWFGEVLNQAVTGCGQLRRGPRSDSDASISESRHVIAMSGVPAGPIPEDLVEGFVVIELNPPDSAGCVPEADLLAKFEEAKPRLFGALLDEVSAALRRLPDIKLDSYPRLADFARILAALSDDSPLASRVPDTFGHVSDTFNAPNATQDTSDTSDTFALEIYLRQLEHLAAEEAECDPLATAIAALVQCRGNWQGTATKLIEVLDRPKAARDWPQSPTAMSLRVTRLAPALRAKGITVDNARSTDSNRTRQILLTADASVQMQQA